MSEGVGFDLSSQQRRALLNGAGLNEDPGMLTLVAQLPQSTDPGVINTRLTSAVQRHEVLRSTLPRVSGLKLPVQVVHDELRIGWLGVHSGAAGAVGKAQRDTLDVEQGPVLAAALAADGDVLVLTAFAAVADLPTLELLAREALGAAPEVADPIQYVEYAAWQQERTSDLTSADADNAAAAWQRLAGEAEASVLTNLAGETAGEPAEPAGLGAGAEVAAPAAGPMGLDAWLAAWALTVARLTGSAAARIGVELDPRQDPELAGAAGPYTTVAPLTFSVPAIGSFAAFAEQVGSDRELAATWLEWAPDVAPAALLFSAGALDVVAARGEFQLELRVAPDGARARIVFGSQGSPALAQRVAAALATVLETSAGAVAEVDVLDAEQVRALLGTPPAALGGMPVIGRLVENARRHPDRVALTDGDQALRYGELIERVDALAGALLDAGAGEDAPVATYLDRGVDLIVAMLAAQRSGAGYLALDVHQPASRSLLTLETVGARLLITDGLTLDGFEGNVVPIRGASPTASPTMPKPEQLSYVIFTSGSTGAPKGVAVSESALANYTEAIVQLVGRLTEGADHGASEPLRWALMTSPTTDLGNTAIFPALASGGALHVVPAQVSQDPLAFAGYVREHRIDIAKLTPSQLAALLADDRADVLPRKVLFLGGEALNPDLAAAVAARGTCRLVNHYGPTETTVGALVNVVDSPATHGETSVPIGWALPGNEALVLDSRRRLVPVGAVGELAISGAGLARGYWGDEARTAESFVAHPYRSGERMYLTGDLVRRAENGAITFLGRRDGQVKIRGFRIERGEIESALLAHPGVQRAAVVVRTDVGPDPQLVGYVVSQVNPSPTEAELRQELMARLPGHMVPARIIGLDTLPLRPNGKLDESALPVPGVAVGEHASPVGPTEESVAAIFASVLGVDSVGVTDDFFALGGHSLLATQIIVGVRAALDVQLPVYAVFEAPTVRGLAELVDQTAVTDVADDELARMIAELAELSDEEAAALLAAEGDGGGADSGVTEQR